MGVIGGGLAGLAAGVTLAEAGHEVELFERSRLLGGRATSFEIGGVEVDNGQHVFLACCDAFQDFVRRVGMGDRLYLQDRFEALIVAHDGKKSRLRAARLPAPFHLVASFVHFRILSMHAKFDVARALASARRESEVSERTFAQWLERRKQGEEAIRVFWRPFFVPALNEPLETMDAREALFTLRTAFLGEPGAARFGYSTVPLAHIAEAAAQRFARVHRSTSVSSIELDGDGTSTVLGKRVSALITTAGERRAFDALVLAVTPPQLLRLLEDPARFGVPALDAYVPHPIIDVHLRMCHPERSRGTDAAFDFAALVDSPVQWVFRKGEGYLVCSMSAAQEYLARSTDDVIALAWEELRAALPALKDAKLEHGAVTRNPEATFSAPRETPRPGPESGLANLAVAGSWTRTGWPDTMESAVRSGIAAARRIIGSE